MRHVYLLDSYYRPQALSGQRRDLRRRITRLERSPVKFDTDVLAEETLKKLPFRFKQGTVFKVKVTLS